MTKDLAPRPQAALIRGRQRLGFLPTWSYWNDRDRQRLLTPLVLVTAIPLAPLVVIGALQLQLSIWLVYLVVFVIYPTVLMGLVERHIRRTLRRRSAGVALEDVVVPAPRPMSRVLPLALFLISGIGVLGAFSNGAWLTVGLSATAILILLVTPFARKILLRLNRATPPAALEEGKGH